MRNNIPWVRIVIVAFNSGDVLQACIDRLDNIEDPDYEVVIVDNASSDDSFKNLVLPNKRFKIITSKINIGFAAGSNLGAQGTKTEWIFTLNPDAFVSVNWLKECKLAIDKFPNYSMISPLLISDRDHNIIDGCGDVLSISGHSWRGGYQQAFTNAPQAYCQVFSPSGACAGYKSRVFLKAGGFDESFFCYKEDVELGLRLNREGETCIYVPRAVVHHVGSSTLGEKHPFILYHSYRNSIYMIAKSFPVLNLIIALPTYFISVLWILIRNFSSKGNLHILKGLSMGMIATPFILLARLFKGLSNLYAPNLDPWTNKGKAYVHMNYSRTDLRNSNNWAKPLE